MAYKLCQLKDCLCHSRNCCPWCFRTPILRPPGHPSCTNENQRVGTVIANTVCEKVKEDISNNLLPEFQLSVDNLIKLRLKEVLATVEAQVNSIKEDMKERFS